MIIDRNKHRTTATGVIYRITSPFRWFASLTYAGSVVLLLCTIAAMLLANSSIREEFFAFFERLISISFGDFTWSISFQHAIDDGLMAIFFFLIGMEIKRELRYGSLASKSQAAFPFFAALGGMILPALLFLSLAGPEERIGWGTPMATDIAFSLGVMALLGRRVPFFMKIILMTLAIVDDLGAVLVIAIFYTDTVHFSYLLLSFIPLSILLTMNYFMVRWMTGYLILGLIIWELFHLSGVHTTIAGVIVAFAIPSRSLFNFDRFIELTNRNLLIMLKQEKKRKGIFMTRHQLGAIWRMARDIRSISSPLQGLTYYLGPIVAFIILPLFALLNAGVELTPSEGKVSHPIDLSLSWKIVISMVFGKVLGISLFPLLAVRLGWARMPRNFKFHHLIGLGFFGGIGFTMAIFIAHLAYADAPMLLESAKIGILISSAVTSCLGLLFCRLTLKSGQTEESEDNTKELSHH